MQTLNMRQLSQPTPSPRQSLDNAPPAPPFNHKKAAALLTMATPTIDTPDYLLYPSPRNEHRMVFAFTHFVPHPMR